MQGDGAVAVGDLAGTQAGSPRPVSSATARSAASGGTTATMPDAHVEGALELVLGDRRRPAAPAPNTGCGVQLPRSTRADRCAGSTRARFAASPPPVTWLIACTSTPAVDQRQAVERRRSGSARAARRPAAGRAPAPRGPAPSRPGVEQHVPHQRVAVGVQPATTPSRPARRRRGPGPAPSSRVGLDDAGRRRRRRRTRPAPSRPGCSAVSPPTSAQPASTQPSAMPLTIAAIRSGTTLPQAM